jgi:methylmalonyl-CoA mutase N-terminal domain/subunit
MTINGRAGHPGDVPQHRHRPAAAGIRRGGRRKPDDAEAAKVRTWVLANVRGTVQADILKEDHGQNTCIFSTEFALRCTADIQQWFTEHQVRNFYSVSISGYRMAEAGANPITWLAFTLANGFIYVEAYLAPGHEHRRLRAQPVVLRSANAWSEPCAASSFIAY